MTVSAYPSADGDTMIIVPPERFDFNVHRDLRNAYESAEKKYAKYVVDLCGTRYMDSAALGMLLQLREFAGGRPDSVRITNADGSVREILRIANFHKLMQVA
jgi:anti-anti-sigma factor